MGAPQVPTFYPGIPVGQVPAEFNAKIRDPFAALLDRPRARLRRTGAYNLTPGTNQWIPFDTADEDSHGGWTPSTDVGGGGNSTLAATTAVGATTLTVASAVGFAAGQAIRVGSGSAIEYRDIASVAGTTITVNRALSLPHTVVGAPVVQIIISPSQYDVPDGWPGWWLVTGNVSLSGTGASNLVLIPSVAVNNTSQTGFYGGGGWEGAEVLVPPSVAKTCSSTWRVYANPGDRIELALFYSTESSIGAVSTVAGEECRMELVWDGA